MSPLLDRVEAWRRSGLGSRRRQSERAEHSVAQRDTRLISLRGVLGGRAPLLRGVGGYPQRGMGAEPRGG